jgi:hypothetical protein
MTLKEKIALMVKAGYQPDITEPIAEYCWDRLEKFYINDEGGVVAALERRAKELANVLNKK